LSLGFEIQPQLLKKEENNKNVLNIACANHIFPAWLFVSKIMV
jgi:hypothetical protein